MTEKPPRIKMERTKQDEIKLCKYPREISISIPLGLVRASMILEFNVFLANMLNYKLNKK